MVPDDGRDRGLNDIEQIRRLIKEDDRPLERAVAADSRRDGRGRRIALVKVIVILYLLFLFAYLGYLFAQSNMMRVDVSEQIYDLIRVALLPLVTLALGYYFGTAGRD